MNSSNAYFVWEVEGKTVSILVNLDAIDRLENAVANDPNSHGILYGRVDQIPGKRCLLVIECLEHSKHLQRVGYYQTAPDLSIAQTDLAPMRRYLTDPASVLLLIRPARQSPATAGFFVWENGTMEQSPSYREFPLNRNSLEQLQMPVLRFGSTRNTSIIQAVRDPGLTEESRLRKLALNPWIWAPAAAAVALLIVSLIMASPHRKTAPDSIPALSSAAQYGQPPSLDLNAQRAGQALRVTWNRSNPAIVDAERGVLWIEDGTAQQRLDLDVRQLLTGTVMYWPSSNDVNFRLEVFGVSKFASESLRAYYGTAQPAAPAPAIADPVPSRQPSMQTRARIKEVVEPPQVPRDEPAPSHPALRPSAPIAPSDEPPPVPATVTPSLVSENPVLEPPRPRKESSPVTTVSLEPVDESALRKVVQTIPGLRVLQRNKYKAGNRFTPATAIEKVTPKIPLALRKEVTGEVPVDLKVSVDEDGKVYRTEAQPGSASGSLVDLAAHSARQWRFSPARIDSKPVSSKVILHFIFKNPS